MNKRIFTILLTITFISSFAIAGEWKPYFGLLHSHTSYSDGMGTPDEAYKYAKEAELDFFALKEAISAFPKLDSGMVALLTISHGGYLTSKAIPHGETE
jgi:hypothetical protein